MNQARTLHSLNNTTILDLEHEIRTLQESRYLLNLISTEQHNLAYWLQANKGINDMIHSKTLDIDHLRHK